MDRKWEDLFAASTKFTFMNLIEHLRDSFGRRGTRAGGEGRTPFQPSKLGQGQVDGTEVALIDHKIDAFIEALYGISFFKQPYDRHSCGGSGIALRASSKSEVSPTVRLRGVVRNPR
jgi:hypothetical protein